MLIPGTLVAAAIAFSVIRFYALPRTETAIISSATPPVPAMPVAAFSSPRTSAGALPEPDLHNLPNFAEVAPGIYRGAAPTKEGWKKLHDLGIRTEIDLRIEKKGRVVSETAAKAYGMERLHLPMGREAPTKKQVAAFLATINDPAKRPVFVHCQYGADRTGAMVGIYRETHDGWDFARTYAEMRRYGFKPFLTELKGAVKTRAPRD